MAYDTVTKTELARRRLIGQLRRSDAHQAQRLAALLDNCTVDAPCWSAACPVCGLAFQQAAAALVEEFVRSPARAIRNRATAIAIVPTSGCVSPDALSVEDFERVGSEILSAFAALDLPATVIGLEASFNEDSTGRLEDHWCVHTHSNQYDWPSNAQENALKDFFPRSRLVARPVRFDRLDERNEASSYPSKTERIRRVTVFITDHPTRARYRDTKRRDLRPWQAVTSALVDHELGFGRRLLVHGIDESLVRQRLEGFGWGGDGS